MSFTETRNSGKQAGLGDGNQETWLNLRCKGRHDTVGHSICKFRDIWVGDMPVGVISIYVVMR